MGWFKKTFGKLTLGRALKSVGKVAPIAAALIPGVGLPMAAAIGAAGRAAQGKVTLGKLLGGAATGAAGGLANRAILGGRGLLGVPGALGRAKSLITGGAQAVLRRGAPAGGVPGVPAAPGGGLLGRAAEFIRNNQGLLQSGLGVLGTVQGAQRQGEADRLRRQALTGLTPGAAPAPDLSDIYADPGNPYARPATRTPLQAARASLRGGY